jgi:hypothetical protein
MKGYEVSNSYQRALSLVDNFEEAGVGLNIIPMSIYEDWTLLDAMRNKLGEIYGVGIDGVDND